MKVTVIFEDGAIIVDLKPKFEFVFKSIDPNWRVIQWQGDCGWVEVHHGDRLWITDPSFIQPYIDLWNGKKSEE